MPAESLEQRLLLTATLDPIDDVTVAPGTGILVPLSGIGGGGNLQVTAVSNDSLVASVTVVSYTSPNATGSIQFEAFAPGLSNSTTITVTVFDDSDTSETSQTFAVNVTGDVTVDVTSIDPTAREFRIIRDGDFVDFFTEANRPGRWNLDALETLTIDGTSGDDKLIVDYMEGVPVPSGGVVFNGGSQSGTPGDSLELSGGSATLITHEFTDASSGSVAIDGADVSYTGLEPIVDQLDADNRDFVFSSANDDIQIGDDGTAANGLSRISTAGTSETVDFVDPTGVIRIFAGGGDDRVRISDLDGGSTAVVAFGGSGGDTLEGGSGDDTLDGGNGNDSLLGNGGNDSLDGGRNEDTLSGGDDNDTLRGSFGDDSLSGDDGDDRILGLGGADVIFGGAGDDFINAGGGNDTVRGEAGNDMIRGAIGDDVLIGGDDNDSLLGGLGNDTLVGNAGNDVLRGLLGDDGIAGGAGDDLAFGNGGSDTLLGEAGNDTLSGGVQADIVLGGDDDDIVRGNANPRDSLAGGDGSDSIVGTVREIDEEFTFTDSWVSLV